MKSLKFKEILRALAVLVVVLVFTSVSYGMNNVRFEPIKNEGKILVELKENANTVTVSIEDSKENVVYYSSNINSTDAFKKVFDVSNLADGTYCFIADFGSKTLKRVFEVENSKVITGQTDLGSVCQPMFRITEDGKLVVLYQSPEKNDIKVTFNDRYKTVFEHNTTDTKLAAKFNISELPAGEYNVVLNSGNNKYSYSLLVK